MHGSVVIAIAVAMLSMSKAIKKEREGKCGNIIEYECFYCNGDGNGYSNTVIAMAIGMAMGIAMAMW